MKRKIVAAAAATALLLGNTAMAAEKPGQWYVTPMASAIWVDNERLVDDDIGAALSIGRALTDDVNVEFHGFNYALENGRELDYWGVGADVARVFYRNQRISPYVLGGFGWSKKNSDPGLDEDTIYGNLALGFLTDVTSNGSIALRTELRYRIDHDSNDRPDGSRGSFRDLMLKVGVQIPFGQPYAQPVAQRAEPAPPPPPPPPPPVDSDGDGVPDSRDQCPGTPRGVTVDAAGCPVDTDGDGVADYLDQCPGTPAGTRVDSRGCPITSVINLEGVTFAFNSSEITGDDRGILNEAVSILERYPDVRVEIAGHTDSVGNATYNMNLSERRAQSVVDFLVDRGIDRDRMTARGYGQNEPIADNATEAGRAMNRRVELRIIE
ncbi:OmpA family protein [Wenzhouxiangella sp. XN24]|uniref:OmpA family protein n=1 Tax=Wenzhouxiangella sp. XN24 TaxID=2713569 RepID=UPI0013EB8E34|nr:OmpA family protein [Wenzhouxiangella sp. XN24]NGX15299.1 OmpA family protein [Wenzhouxiangella sp. XN24]